MVTDKQQDIWTGWVGEQTPEEFLSLCDGGDIRAHVINYMDEMPRTMGVDVTDDERDEIVEAIIAHLDAAQNGA